jgi:hypothetical protein
MEAIALSPVPPATTAQAVQLVGRIVCLSGTEFLVELESGRTRAQRAVSCLVAPEPGDRVLVGGASEEELFILAILQRNGERPKRITSEGDLVLELDSGSFTVAAREGIALHSPQTVGVTAARVEVQAGQARLVVGKAQVIGEAIDAIWERLTQRVKTSFRRVDGLDQVRSGAVDYSADGMMRLHAENTMVTAKGLVKTDAAQVHIG